MGIFINSPRSVEVMTVRSPEKLIAPQRRQLFSIAPWLLQVMATLSSIFSCMQHRSMMKRMVLPGPISATGWLPISRIDRVLRPASGWSGAMTAMTGMRRAYCTCTPWGGDRL
ncbi:hypothetical protein D3C72_1942700 [compost metagenome]